MIENKKARGILSTEKIIQVAATLAIEEMYVGEDIINNLLAVGKKEKTIDDCIRELDKIYGES